ncbi:MAG: TatD family hydrolase [Clostridia bacterium]|nr:TatD family hydrolase [Clostridia bacterium]
MGLIFDTHAHYDDFAFDVDREEKLSLLPNDNIYAVINAGADIKSSKKSINLSEDYPYIYAAVGIHPENISNIPNDYIFQLEKLILSSKKIVGLGEIGLDYHYTKENKQQQKDLFESQVKLAIKHDLPVIVHDREAHGDTLEILKKYKPKGVVHCFSGSLEMAKEVIKMGMYIGVGGVVTFKNAKNAVYVVENISLENIVLETEAPYMSPVPLRGKRCDSSYIKYTAEKISEIKNIELNEVFEITKQNAKNLFGVK